MTYTQFTTGNVPGVQAPNDPTKGMPILKIGDSKNSNIILALSGSGPIFGPPGPPTTIGPMPPFPPALPDPQIKALADWIDAKCPEFPTPPTPAAPQALNGTTGPGRFVPSRSAVRGPARRA